VTVLVANVFDDIKINIFFLNVCFVTFPKFFVEFIQHPQGLLYFKMYHPFHNQILFVIKFFNWFTFNLFNYNCIFT
jgi:hypothetical protein